MFCRLAVRRLPLLSRPTRNVSVLRVAAVPRRNVCSIATEVEGRVTPTEETMTCTVPCPPPSNSEHLCNATPHSSVVVEKYNNAVPFTRRVRHVHISSMARQHLPREQQDHLSQLEALLRRRVPHLCTVAPGALHDANTTNHLTVERSACHACRASELAAQVEKSGISTSTLSGPSSKPSHEELFVMSRVVARQCGLRSSTDVCSLNAAHSHTQFCSRCQYQEHLDDEVFTGINHAFHKHVNPRGATLRGILKGCAEQNALGAAAASGCAYSDITDVFVLAARLRRNTETNRENDNLGMHRTNTHSCSVSLQAADIFPCPECWRHLCHVARVRRESALAPLRLHVCASAPTSTLSLIALAQERMAVIEEAMEVCIVTQ